MGGAGSALPLVSLLGSSSTPRVEPSRGAPLPRNLLGIVTLREFLSALLVGLLGALAAPVGSRVSAQPGTGFVERSGGAVTRAGGFSERAGGFTLARLKYTGGGDWYSDETSLWN